MKDRKKIIARLGQEPPLTGDGRPKLPDRREISVRWLSGTFLTGITSSFLMGTALLVSLDNHQHIPIASINQNEADKRQTVDHQNSKAPRIIASRQIMEGSRERKRLEASTLKKEGNKNVIRSMPLVEINMSFETSYKSDDAPPPFDPLMICIEDEPQKESTTSGQIYSVKAENEMELKISPFPRTAIFDEIAFTPINTIEKMVRTAGKFFTDGKVKVAALHFMPESEERDSLKAKPITDIYGIKIVPENFSVSHMVSQGTPPPYRENIIPILAETSIESALTQASHTAPLNTEKTAQVLESMLNTKLLPAGSVLRIYLKTTKETTEIVRASIYHGANHIITIALNDQKNYITAKEPISNPTLRMAFGGSTPSLTQRKPSTVYEGVFHAARVHGVSQQMALKLLRTLAVGIDLQSLTTPADKLKLLFSNPDEKNQLSNKSQLLYISAIFAGKKQGLYRYQMSDGTVDFFDRNGRSAKQFLIRNPVPNGRFSSHFGNRRHPILGYMRAHNGVDWSAPHGTPILASGNGTVEKSGWTSGYGKQTIIRHANGYVTSYAHQSRIVKEISPGAPVRQGQIIGYVGSTGLSTGSHLHYELIVNGTKVDPMRIRLPASHSLKGESLNAFIRERNRLDQLMQNASLGKSSKTKES